MGKYQFHEIGASVYAWDMHDEGVETVLDNLKHMAHVNSVYLVALMHEERHPWPDGLAFPHNPVRREYVTEDSVAYWKADRGHYGRIAPAGPTNFLKGTDWLELLVKEAKKRGMKAGVEFSHTLIDSRRLNHELADVCQVDLFGKPLVRTHIGEHHRVPCMNHPDFLKYAKNLYAEVVTEYDVDYVLNCIMPYPAPASYLLTEYDAEHHPLRRAAETAVRAGCFCPACRAKAGEMGVDLEAIRDGLLDLVEDAKREPALEETNVSLVEFLMNHKAFEQWISFKCASVAAFHGKLHDVIKRLRPEVENRLNLYVTSHPEYAGFWGKALAPSFDEVRVCCYTEHLGIADAAEKKRRVLSSAARSFGPGMNRIGAIGVLPGATAESVKEGILTCGECGVSSIMLGHYDGAESELLKAVGRWV